MNTLEPKTWNDFEETIARIRQEYGIRTYDLDDGQTLSHKVDILFRGQSNAQWDLLTTLDRLIDKPMDVLEYLRRATRRVAEIESFTGKQWNTKTYPELREEILQTQDSFRVHLPCYDYLVYLRHHGFPSPLLDWTESPFIAAYFAYVDCKQEAPAAVYCYIERPKGSKGGVGGQPFITLKGPYVTTHQRHFAQKAWYTIATIWDYDGKRHTFCPHERVFGQDNPRQDFLIKIVLPADQRLEALKRLEDYNINHFTLFQSEDALIKTVATRVFDIGE